MGLRANGFFLSPSSLSCLGQLGVDVVFVRSSEQLVVQRKSLGNRTSPLVRRFACNQSTNTPMNAHLETTFKRGFLLTEESLIKLDDIARRRLHAADPDSKVKLKVFRADGMLVEFDSASGVAAEENSSRNAIKRVEIFSSTDAYKLSLTFDAKENTSLEIEANDRDLAYLLASDIKDYVHSEVLKFRSFTFDSAMNSKNIFPFLMLPMMYVGFSAIKEAPKADVIAALVASNDVHAKLNLLIESRASQDAGPMKWYMAGMFALLICLFFLGSLLDRGYPRNIFYWGKQAQVYDRLLGLREKIVWGIIIATVISIASTVMVDYFKSPAQTSGRILPAVANSATRAG